MPFPFDFFLASFFLVLAFILVIERFIFLSDQAIVRGHESPLYLAPGLKAVTVLDFVG